MWWNRMLKRFNNARIRCPVVVYEEINAVFLERKRPKNDKKKQKYPDFKHCYAIFVKLSIDFVDKNVDNAQHGTSSLSSRLSEEIIAVFQMKKIDTENFQSFNATFVKLLPDFVDWSVQKGQKGKNLLSIRLYGRVITVF